MAEKNYNKFYNHLWSKNWAMATLKRGPSSMSRMRFICKMMMKYAGNSNKIADIGCGDGSLLRIIHKKKDNAYLFGSDISENALELAKSKSDDNIIFSQWNVEYKFDEMKNLFDLLICDQVFEHVNNDVLGIKNIVSLLKKDAVLILSVPHSMKFWTKHDDAVGHLRRYEINDIKNKISNAGCSILNCYSWGFPFFNLYYSLVLNKVSVATTMNRTGIFKRLASFFFYNLFRLDDFFVKNKKGRLLFIIAKKK